MTGRACRYPRLRSATREAVSFFRSSRPDLKSNAQVAKAIGLSSAALSGFLNGVSVPGAESIPKLIKLYEEDRERAAGFKAVLHEFKDKAERKTNVSGGLTEQLANGVMLPVSTLNYWPISGVSPDPNVGSAFLDPLFRRFFGLAGINTGTFETRDGIDFRRPEASTEPRIFLSYFSSLDRSLLWHFWSLPIRVSLGGVMLTENGYTPEFASDAAQKLSLPPAIRSRVKGHKDVNLRGIVVPGEVGEIHFRHNVNETTETVSGLDPELYIRALTGAEKDHHVNVAVMDELTSFKCLDKLGKQGWPVLPLTGRRRNQGDPLRRELPQFFVSFACSRRHKELIDFVNQSWDQYLRLEVETTARALAELADNLLGQVMSCADAYVRRGDHIDLIQGITTEPSNPSDLLMAKFLLAFDWTVYTCQLDRASIEAHSRMDPWRPILERAREQWFLKLAENHASEIGRFVETVIRPGKTVSYDDLDHLSAILDVPLDRDSLHFNLGILDRETLKVAAVEAMKGKRVKPDVVAVFRHAGDPDVDKRVRDNLKDLANFYERLEERGGNAASVIRDLVDPAKFQAAFGAGENGLVVAYHQAELRASATQQDGPACLGSACLRRINQGPFEGYHELRYVWVQEKYRRIKVAEALTVKAQDQAKAWKSKGLVAFVLPPVRSAILLFLSQGFEFEPEGDKQDNPGRLVLTWKVPVSKGQ